MQLASLNVALEKKDDVIKELIREINVLKIGVNDPNNQQSGNQSSKVSSCKKYNHYSYSYVSHICCEGDMVQLTSKFTETLVATLLCALTHFTDNSHDVLEYTRNARVLEHTYKYLHVLQCLSSNARE